MYSLTKEGAHGCIIIDFLGSNCAFIDSPCSRHHPAAKIFITAGDLVQAADVLLPACERFYQYVSKQYAACCVRTNHSLFAVVHDVFHWFHGDHKPAVQA